MAFAYEKEISKHYSDLKDENFKERKKSGIFTLRNFNNFLKSILIDIHSNILKQQLNKPLVILDICCGKGGDINKWNLIQPEHVIFVDIAGESLKQCEIRYKNLKAVEKNLFKAYFIEADCCKINLKSKFQDLGLTFDLVSCQFSLHYAFQSYDRLRCMLANITSNMSENSMFIGTMTDANRLMNILINLPLNPCPSDQNHKYLFENEICKIRFDHQSFTSFKNLKSKAKIESANESIIKNSLPNVTSIKRQKLNDTPQQPPLTGANLSFILQDRVDCTEFLAYFPFLKKILTEEFGMFCTMNYNLQQFYEVQRGKYWDMAKRMKIFEGYNGKKMSNNPEYAHVAQFLQNYHDNKRSKQPDQSNNDVPKNIPQLCTLSKSEWDVIGCYIAFAFRKIPTEKK